MKLGIRTVTLLAASSLVLLAACGAPAASVAAAPADILTQKELSPDKTDITVLVKFAFSINTFEAAAEEFFPNLNIIQVGNYTSQSGVLEYAARLEHDDLTDIVMTWPLDVGKEYWPDRLLDLSSLASSSQYNISMLNTISQDGHLYYLPGPSQVRGIVYNKTLFAENGWEVPTSYDGFVTLCQEIEKTGIRALQLGLANSEVLDTAFVGYGYADSFSSPENRQWLADYDSGKGSFGDHFMPALNVFQDLIDQGILQPADLKVDYARREQMIFTRQCAMIEDSVLMARMGHERTGSTDEFALMPFFNPTNDSDWARLYPVCYIGVNKRLAQQETKEKLDLVLQLLDYISTPVGQMALMGDTGSMYSALNGMPPTNVPEAAALQPALAHGRCAAFPTLKNAQNALRKGLAGMVSGKMTAADVVKAVDLENAAPPASDIPLVLGQATENFSLTETGNYITDVMRKAGGADFALLLDNGKDGRSSGKGLNAKLYKGDVTETDLMRLIPDSRAGEKNELQVATMTGQNLLNALEYTLPVDNDRGGWFYYFSGLRMKYAPSAEPGKRIYKITDSDGAAIEPQKEYKVAILDLSVATEYCKTVESTGILLKDLLSEAIQSDKTISPSGDGRFTTIEPKK